MDLAKNILNAIGGVTKSLPSAFINAKIYDKDSKVYNSDTAKVVYSERVTDVKAVFERFKLDEIDGKIVKNFDIKITVLPSSKSGFEFDFSSVDRIEVDGQNYTIVVSLPQYVGKRIVAYLLHVRPQGSL